MTDSELIQLLRLQRIPNIGDVSAKKLLRHFGGAEAIFKEKRLNTSKIKGINKNISDEISNTSYLDEAKEELEFIKENDIKVSFFKDEDYPDYLKHCIDGPLLLFQKGNIDLKNKKIISIVGTRKATVQGKDFCEKLVGELAPLDPVIVSGFAYGIDITAHKAAMDNGLQTIACLAHGLNRIYPEVHEKYCGQMKENGGFVTDFWSSSQFLPQNFLSRNRIIAGMSEATIVVESAKKGGSLVTAEIANSYNREVFSVPGRPKDKFSMGCNALIKSQRSHLLTDAADLIYILNWDIKKSPPQQQQLFEELTDEEGKLIETLRVLGKSELDEISLKSGLPTFRAANLLLSLELKGMVRPLPGKKFEIV